MDNIEELNPLLQKYKSCITKNIIKNIYKEHLIYDNKKNTVCEKDMIEYIKKLNDPKKRCCSISINTYKQCNKNAIEKYNYCKSHIMTYSNYKDSFPQNKESSYTKLDTKININLDLDFSQLNKKFIGDSFYYIDSQYIYDNSKQKVGYVENGEYNLTDDPFILQLNI